MAAPDIPPPSPPPSIASRTTLLIACAALILAFQFPTFLTTLTAVLTGSPFPSTFPTPTPTAPPSRPPAPSFNWTNTPSHPRHRLFVALRSLSLYRTTLTRTLTTKHTRFLSLPAHHRRLLSAASYSTKLSHSATLIDKNDALATDVLAWNMGVYNVSASDLAAFRGIPDVSAVSQSLALLVRDWALAGEHERAATFPQVLDAVGRVSGRVLVPGAGAGRLVYEIAGMRGVREVVANEYSYACILVARWVMGQSGAWRMFPNVGMWSHRRTTEGGLWKEVEVPDVEVRREVVAKVEWREGDFVEAFAGEQEAFDAVVSLFFIDTARNIVEYIERIHAVLKTGGTWINCGPLLYGTKPLVELSLDEVLMVVEEVGFELLPVDEKWGRDTFPESGRWRGKVRSSLAGYSWDPGSMSRNAYDAQFWVARKI